MEYRLKSCFETGFRSIIGGFKGANYFSMSRSPDSLRIYRQTEASEAREQSDPYRAWLIRLVLALAVVVGLQWLLGIFEFYR